MITHTLRLRATLLIDPELRPNNLSSRLQALRRDLDGIIDAAQSDEVETTDRQQNVSWTVGRIQVNGAGRDEAALSLAVTFGCHDTNPVDIHRFIEGHCKPRLAARINAFLRDIQQLPNADRWVLAHQLAWDDECVFNGQPTTLHKMKAARGQFHIES